MKLVITCEHGGNFVPKKYQPLFKKQETVLQTHRGFDPGTLDLFQYLKPLSHFSIFSDTSRLLIELNRSLHHRSEERRVGKESTKQVTLSHFKKNKHCDIAV